MKRIFTLSVFLTTIVSAACGTDGLHEPAAAAPWVDPGNPNDPDPNLPPAPCETPDVPTTLVDDLTDEVRLIATDADAVYWTTSTYTTGVGAAEQIWRLPKGGGPATPVGPEMGALRAMAVYGGAVYVIEVLEILRLDPGSSAPVSLLHTSGYPMDLAVTARGIYWVDASDGFLMRANLDGSGAEALVSGQRGPQQLRLSDDHAYWLNNGSEHKIPAYSLMRVSLDGGEAESLAGDQTYAHGFTLDGADSPSHIYVGTGSQIIRLRPDGTGMEVLADDASLRGLPAVDATRVYWTEYSQTAGRADVMGMLKNALTPATAVVDVSTSVVLTADRTGVYFVGDGAVTRLCF